VPVEGGAVHPEQAGDLGDGVLAAVVEASTCSAVSFEGWPPLRPRARAAASPSRVLATIKGFR